MAASATMSACSAAAACYNGPGRRAISGANLDSASRSRQERRRMARRALPEHSGSVSWTAGAGSAADGGAATAARLTPADRTPPPVERRLVMLQLPRLGGRSHQLLSVVVTGVPGPGMRA